MNLNSYNLCDDWGWYVDTDNTLFINSNRIDFNITNTSYKKMNYHYNRLYKIEEDEYDYFKNNYKDIENLELDYSYKKIEKKQENTQVKIKEKNSNSVNIVLYVSSTTIIAVLLTYSILFLI